MKNVRIGRVNVRLFWRGFDCPQWPYFSTRYTIASFGAGPFGVMLMQVMTRAEIVALNRAASVFPLPPRGTPDGGDA